MKLNDLEKHLRDNGCVKKREGGNHSIWESPSNVKIAPVPRHKEIKEILVNKICKQLGIPLPR